MTLRISRDHTGKVIILDPSTGKSETVATAIIGQPAQKTVTDVAALPSHSWGQLSS